MFVDDTRLTVGGTVVEADGFEADGGAWAVEGPPAGSPPGIHGNFAITQELIPVASSVATEDTALLGFGIESLATPPAQADVLGRVLEHAAPAMTGIDRFPRAARARAPRGFAAAIPDGRPSCRRQMQPSASSAPTSVMISMLSTASPSTVPASAT